MERIIPAYAGSTVVVGIGIHVGKGHPRLRGEHLYLGNEIDALRGSPPLTRGALRVVLRHHHDAGVTPAYAGSTLADLRKHAALAGFSITFLPRADPVWVGVDGGRKRRRVPLKSGTRPKASSTRDKFLMGGERGWARQSTNQPHR